jgi:hypothetical protein
VLGFVLNKAILSSFGEMYATGKDSKAHIITLVGNIEVIA